MMRDFFHSLHAKAQVSVDLDAAVMRSFSLMLLYHFDILSDVCPTIFIPWPGMGQVRIRRRRGTDP